MNVLSEFSHRMNNGHFGVYSTNDVVGENKGNGDRLSRAPVSPKIDIDRICKEHIVRKQMLLKNQLFKSTLALLSYE